MDALTMVVIIALIGAIILFEVNKRQSAKTTVFFNGNNIGMLIDADRKIKAILTLVENAKSEQPECEWPNVLSEQLSLITDKYINNDLTLSEYNTALDELLNSRLAYITGK